LNRHFKEGNQYSYGESKNSNQYVFNMVGHGRFMAVNDGKERAATDILDTTAGDELNE
jgi:hypothetical protein